MFSVAVGQQSVCFGHHKLLVLGSSLVRFVNVSLPRSVSTLFLKTGSRRLRSLVASHCRTRSHPTVGDTRTHSAPIDKRLRSLEGRFHRLVGRRASAQLRPPRPRGRGQPMRRKYITRSAYRSLLRPGVSPMGPLLCQRGGVSSGVSSVCDQLLFAAAWCSARFAKRQGFQLLADCCILVQQPQVALEGRCSIQLSYGRVRRYVNRR